ncbi:MAG: UbiD family decarboxylase [Micromonosporaceae bacterium]
MSQDLRHALTRLRESGDLVTIDQPLSWEYELAAVLWELQQGPAALFANVTGYRTPVVGNLLNRRDKLATSLGIPAEQLQSHLAEALANPIPPTVSETGPCLETRHPGEVDLTELLPIPLISESDGGRYISAGVLICKDPDTGRRNMAICRVQVKAPGMVGVYMAPTHSRGMLSKHRARGSRMEVAIAIGLHPGLMAASQFLTPLDETHLAGGLFREPMELTRARTVDLEVPAYAEVVLEGTIDPHEAEPEGPFGEFPGTYAPQRPNPVIRLSAVATRTDPIFQMIVGGRHPEHLVTGAIAREAGLYEAIQAVVPSVTAVRLTAGGTCRFHAVVSIRKHFPGEGRLAILTAFAKQDLIKHVTVVDDDIDIGNPVDVEWAVATRMRAHEDLVTVPQMKSNPVDPMSIGGAITKLGIDATLPVDAASETRQRVDVPRGVRDKIRSALPDIVGTSTSDPPPSA